MALVFSLHLGTCANSFPREVMQASWLWHRLPQGQPAVSLVLSTIDFVFCW